MKSKKLKFFAVFFIFLPLYGAFPEYYYKIKDVKKQKKAFVEIMLPLIKQENQNILALRKKIIQIFNDPNLLLNFDEISFLKKIAKKYKIKNFLNEKEFLKKIDTIPPSLALAQAAIESGWGKSRFVKVANNLFGHWQYSNKGIKPKSKYENITIDYSLKIFPSIEDSLRAYMLNLNRNRAYKNFREKRYQYKLQHKIFTGIEAAKTLKHYSQLKDEYVKRVIKLIKYNHWQKYDF